MPDVGKNVEQVGFPYTNTGNANWYIFPHFHTMPQRFSLRHVYTNDSAMEVTRYVLNRNKFKESSKTYTRLSIATVDRLAPIAWKNKNVQANKPQTASGIAQPRQVSVLCCRNSIKLCNRFINMTQ